MISNVFSALRINVAAGHPEIVTSECRKGTPCLMSATASLYANLDRRSGDCLPGHPPGLGAASPLSLVDDASCSGLGGYLFVPQKPPLDLSPPRDVSTREAAAHRSTQQRPEYAHCRRFRRPGLGTHLDPLEMVPEPPSGSAMRRKRSVTPHCSPRAIGQERSFGRKEKFRLGGITKSPHNKPHAVNLLIFDNPSLRYRGSTLRWWRRVAFGNRPKFDCSDTGCWN